ncbi:hypothetical protein [Paludibacterium sp. B53371]|uniref:hypothetical protein n=1 Tax=Paludibacterium sp. B53371 TaxID=2806263 RepID=UPI001C05823E|nr:hypothetical protein [Paludibacterium sp. B53371]
MWVSPAFNLEVIRLFDEVQTHGIAVSDRVKGVEVNAGVLLEAAIEAVERKGGLVREEELDARRTALQHINQRKGASPKKIRYLMARAGYLHALDGLPVSNQCREAMMYYDWGRKALNNQFIKDRNNRMFDELTPRTVKRLNAQ